jgi:hypothetical protein
MAKGRYAQIVELIADSRLQRLTISGHLTPFGRLPPAAGHLATGALTAVDRWELGGDRSRLMVSR